MVKLSLLINIMIFIRLLANIIAILLIIMLLLILFQFQQANKQIMQLIDDDNETYHFKKYQT